MHSKQIINEIIHIVNEFSEFAYQTSTFDGLLLENSVFEYEEKPNSIKRSDRQELQEFRDFFRNRIQALLCLLYTLIDDEKVQQNICEVLKEMKKQDLFKKNKVIDIEKKRFNKLIKEFFDK